MLYIGLMSGTSSDAIDAALIDINAQSVRLVATHRDTIDDDTRALIRRATASDPLDDDLLDYLDRELGTRFANSTNSILTEHGIDRSRIAAIGSHGQTIRHEPDALAPFSLQVGDGSIIAATTGIITVTNFREADMEAGGQGAPLAPAFHNAVFRSAVEDRAVLNIGGIANLTYLPADPASDVIGFDTGPGNTLMDAWIWKHRNLRYDEHGAWAASAAPDPELLAALLADPYFPRSPPKSTGLEYFNLTWLKTMLLRTLADDAVQATLLALTVESISSALWRFLPKTQSVFVCGGGAYNAALMQSLRKRLDGITVDTTQSLGIDPDWIEASAFAWLAHRRMQELPGNLPSVTGAQRSVLLGNISHP